MEYKTLNDGNKIPMIGLGTYRINPADAERAVKIALANGYTSIDTANVYFNEEAVGRGIKASGVDRSKLFVTSKIFPTVFDDFDKAVEDTLRRLQLDYLDLLLLHRPYGDYLSAYSRLLNARKKGLVRSVGVSNFTLEQIEELHEKTGVYPAINQIELNVERGREKEQPQFEGKGVAVESWFPFGGNAKLLDDPVIEEIAGKLGKSPAQIVLNYLIDRGVIVIPGSKTESHIKDNLDVFSFSLTEDEKAALAKLSRKKPHGDLFGPLTYRFLKKDYFEKKN